jgi:short-subunit dehydrogenase
MAEQGKWAIITGASSGIGKALALEFAAGGFNIFLTARNEQALAEVAQECSRKYNVDTDTATADLSELQAIDQLIARISVNNRRYEVLVNNAGFGIHGDFASGNIDENIRLLNVQLAAALKLTRAVLPSMTARGSGRILNVASVYSFSPVPYQSVYSASKAFLLSFSSSLRNELRGTGVSVSVFCPGVTQTEFRARAGMGEKKQGAGMSADAAAHIAYVQTLRGKDVIVPGLLNNLYVFFARHLPLRIATHAIRLINRKRLTATKVSDALR